MSVSPCLVAISVGRARRVLLKAVAVAIAIAVDPVEAALCRRLEWGQLGDVADPSVVLGEKEQIKRRRIRGAVVGAVRNDPEMRPLADT